MKKVIKHGKYYKEKHIGHFRSCVICPECNSRIYCDLGYPKLLFCGECECEFEFEFEDVEYLYEEE